MTIRSFLLGCFGGDSGKGQVIEGVDAHTSGQLGGVTSSSKAQEVAIKSKELSDSSSSLPLSSAPEPKAPIKALCVVAKRTYGIATDVPYPSINTPDEIIIRTNSVGLNPIDWKSVDYNFCMPSFPWIGGRELAGVVEEVGSNVKDFQPGDRVWASK